LVGFSKKKGTEFGAVYWGIDTEIGIFENISQFSWKITPTTGVLLLVVGFMESKRRLKNVNTCYQRT